MQELLDHDYAGFCPDEFVGWNSFDPECIACNNLQAVKEILDGFEGDAGIVPIP